jgi:hypothetical protein
MALTIYRLSDPWAKTRRHFTTILDLSFASTILKMNMLSGLREMVDNVWRQEMVVIVDLWLLTLANKGHPSPWASGTTL